MNRAKQFRNIVRAGARPGRLPILCALSLFPITNLFGLSFDAPSMENGLRWQNAIGWMEALLPALQHGMLLLAYYWIAALLPMSIFPRMRPLIATTLRLSSLFIAGVCWWQSIIVTYQLLGWLSVMMGLLFAGVGVVPLAFITTAVRQDWAVFGDLITALALAIIPYFIAKFMTTRTVKTALNDRATIYYGDD